jgi:hypothetical protein
MPSEGELLPRLSMEDPPTRRLRLRKRLAWTVRIAINAFAGVGLVLIVYECIASLSDERWAVIDKRAQSLGAGSTLVGALITTVSIYVYTPRTTPPEWISKWITAPLIGCSCVISIGVLIKEGSIPANIVNGYAILAIAGALLRIQPHPMHIGSRHDQSEGWLFSEDNHEVLLTQGTSSSALEESTAPNRRGSTFPMPPPRPPAADGG